MAKKTTIIYMHLVMFIIKLKFSKTFNLIIYFGIKKYVVFFLQNLAFLLIFLFFLTLILHNIIYII